MHKAISIYALHINGKAIPRVDVIIAVRNGLPFIEDAVRTALEQVGVLTRVIVVDDGSTDGTVEALTRIDSSRLEIHKGHTSESASSGRNRGVLLSGAKWLSFLDSDDLWPRDRTKLLIDAIIDSQRSISLGYVVEFRGEPPDLVETVQKQEKPALCVGGTLFSREVYDFVGPLNEKLRVAEYVDWLSRSRDLGVKEVVVPAVSLYRRMHNNNTSTARKHEYQRDVFSLIMEHKNRVRSSD